MATSKVTRARRGRKSGCEGNAMECKRRRGVACQRPRKDQEDSPKARQKSSLIAWPRVSERGGRCVDSRGRTCTSRDLTGNEGPCARGRASGRSCQIQATDACVLLCRVWPIAVEGESGRQARGGLCARHLSSTLKLTSPVMGDDEPKAGNE